MTVLSIADLSLSFGTRKILDKISFSLNEDDKLGVIGVNGCGKSTLFKVITGELTPDEGNVTIDGKAVAGMSDGELSEFRNRHVGFVFQSHHLLEEFSSEENVMMPMLIAGVKRSEAQERAKELLELVQMSHRLTHRPSALSGGEQQRVAIARALANNPSVVLADEPTGNLDTATREQIQNLFFDLRERTNQTFIIVTHDEALAEKSDRKIVMSDGRIL